MKSFCQMNLNLLKLTTESAEKIWIESFNSILTLHIVLAVVFFKHIFKNHQGQCDSGPRQAPLSGDILPQKQVGSSGQPSVWKVQRGLDLKWATNNLQAPPALGPWGPLVGAQAWIQTDQSNSQTHRAFDKFQPGLIQLADQKGWGGSKQVGLLS